MSIIIQLSHCGLATTALAHGILTLTTGIMLLTVRLCSHKPSGEWLGILKVAHTALGVLTGFYGVTAYLIAPR